MDEKHAFSQPSLLTESGCRSFDARELRSGFFLNGTAPDRFGWKPNVFSKPVVIEPMKWVSDCFNTGGSCFPAGKQPMAFKCMEYVTGMDRGAQIGFVSAAELCVEVAQCTF